MANELRSPALLQAITCILALERSDDGVVQLADQLTSIVDAWSQPEFAICRQEYLWSYRINVAAGGAGFNSIAQVHNDSTDGIVCVQGWIATGTVGALAWGRTSTLATTDNGLVAIARDGRFPRPSVPYVRSRSQNGIATPAGFSNGIFGQSIGASIALFDSPVILRPQGTFFINDNTVNEAMTVTFVGWSRRALNNREITPSA